MLFCDIAGYSKLKEEHIPAFLEFLTRLKAGLAGAGVEPVSINTWGDAIFAVMDKATPMAEYALTMQEVVTRLGDEMRALLPKPLNLRISLHAGPVFESQDPICGRRNFYGSHINRAARLEPVTVIGHVYATQQFVAVLTAEQSAMRSEAVNNGEPFVEKYAAEYVGVLSLAKDFGRQTVYHLRRCTEAEIQSAAVEIDALPEIEVEVPAVLPEPDPEPLPEPEPEPEPAPEPVADLSPPAADEGITERPAPGVESVLATVARMIERAEAAEAGTKPKGRKKKAKDTPADLVLLDGDETHWPGA
jgi:class 3 adenylate cyclase